MFALAFRSSWDKRRAPIHFAEKSFNEQWQEKYKAE
jgi:hypothetical protein